MPLTTIARGEGKAHQKADNLLWAAKMETGLVHQQHEAIMEPLRRRVAELEDELAGAKASHTEMNEYNPAAVRAAKEKGIVPVVAMVVEARACSRRALNCSTTSGALSDGTALLRGSCWERFPCYTELSKVIKIFACNLCMLLLS